MLPFPQLVQYGNIVVPPVLTDQYIGLVSTNLYSTIMDTLNPSGTRVSQQGTFRCFKFVYNSKYYIIPSQPFAIASYKEVYEKGMVYGSNDNGPDIFDSSSGIALTTQSQTITLEGSVYKIMLPTGAPTSTVSNFLSNDPQYYNPMSDWERFFYSTWSNTPTSFTKGYSDVPAADKVTRFTFSSSTRRWALCQGSDGSRTSPRSLGRGRFDTASSGGDYEFSQICTTSIAPLWTQAINFWWPIFVKNV